MMRADVAVIPFAYPTHPSRARGGTWRVWKFYWEYALIADGIAVLGMHSDVHIQLYQVPACIDD